VTPHLGLTAWRRAQVQPSANDQAREDAFLDQHIESGALIHQVTAETLVAALKVEQDVGRRELMALRVFAEYVGALETLGAWGWSIRNRRDAPLLLDAFLSYSVGDVRDFYEIVSTWTAELSDLLNLPQTEEITDAFRRGGFPHGPMLAEFGRLEKNLQQASEHYFHPQELFVTSYNKAKHGAPIAHDPTLDVGEFLLIAPERDPTQIGRYVFFKFGSSDEIVEHTLKLVRWVSHSTQALVSFARNLKTAGLLY
jgi:hypothetical protein